MKVFFSINELIYKTENKLIVIKGEKMGRDELEIGVSRYKLHEIDKQQGPVVWQ